MKLLISFLLASLVLVSFSCNSVNESSESSPHSPAINISDEWIIPKDEVLDGGPGRDGIPSIDNPKFSPAKTIEYVSDDRLVVGIKIGETVKAYPHEVMDYHEIVNDRIGDQFFSLTYCPLTGTAIGWERSVGQEFGVSGLLFRNNLIPYDRNTGTHYSQMQMRAVNGALSGNILSAIPVIQTTWSTWKSVFPESQVLTTDTGYNRDYNTDLYGKGYREGDSATLFPIKNRDDRLPKKKIVHGIILGTGANEESSVRIYEIDKFGTGINVLKDHFPGKEITVVGSTDKNFAVSFFNILNGTKLEFEVVHDAFPVIMKDQEGNHWDLFGYAVEGPRKGERLRSTNSYSGYWFAWADFFPQLDIHRHP